MEKGFFGARFGCLLYRKGDGSWPRKWEEAAAWGSGADSRTQHPGELEDRKRGPEAVVVVSTPKVRSSWARQEGAAFGREQEIVRDFPACVRWGCSCSHLSWSPFWTGPAAWYLPLLVLQSRPCRLHYYQSFLVIWLTFKAGKNLVVSCFSYFCNM